MLSTIFRVATTMDYTLPDWKIKQLKKFHKTLKQKYEADGRIFF